MSAVTDAPRLVRVPGAAPGSTVALRSAARPASR
jgi:hypothetical protein